MKIVGIGLCGAIVAGGIYLHGPLRYGHTYDRPLDDAYEAVRNLAMPRQFERMVDKVPSGSVDKDYVDRQQVIWHFKAKGKEAARFTVSFQPTDDPAKVYVSTSYEEFDGSDLLYDGSDKLMGDPALFESVARAAMTEQVDAKLEKRPYDRQPVQKIMAGWVMKNMGAIQQEVGTQMEEASKQFRDADGANERARQAAEARRFSDAKPMNSGKPLGEEDR